MKARFNYDLSEVKEMLRLAQSLQSLDDLPKEKPIEENHRGRERQMLIDRAEYLTHLMETEREKARAAQSNVSAIRVMNLLKAS